MKATAIREFTDAELLNSIEEHQREYFNLGVQSQTGQLENSSRIRIIRRILARLRTEQTTRNKRR